jgi:hypothetical protein
MGEPLILNPASGDVGTTVTAIFPDVSTVCTSSTVLWDGTPIGSSGTDGAGEVVFVIPGDSDPGGHAVNVTCDQHTGRGTFFVDGGSTTTTVVASTVTTAPQETTTAVSGTTVPETSVPGEVTTTESTSPGVPPEAPQSVEECEREASKAEAQLVYEPQRRMVVDRTYEVKAALGLEELPPDITFEGTTTVVPLPLIRCTIRANLSGTNFDVTPNSDPEQSFIGTRVLQWRWDVRPKQVGTSLKLTLSFQAIFVEGGRSVPGQSVLHQALIEVDATPVSFWSKLGDGITGFFSHPVIASVTTAAVLAAAAWLGRLLWRRFKKPSPTGKEEEPPATPA